VIRRGGSLTINRSLGHLLALTAFLLGNRGGFFFVVVVVVRRGHLALSAAALLRSSRGRGSGLAAGVLDLLQSGVGADPHAVD
jgi:hypothetical protein